MNKLISTLCLLFTLFIYNTSSAQSCNNSSASECTPTATLVQPGLEHPDSVACVEQGLDYDETIQIKMFTIFNAAGSVYNVDSIEFVKIDSLPCGLCWSMNKPNNRLSSNEYGCIRIHGNSSDAVGQYKMFITLKAWLNGNPALPVPPNLVDDADVKLYIRVKSPSGPCTATDTSANNISTTPALCLTSSNDLNADLTGLSITPNPVNSQSVFTFNCVKSETYTLRIADITGKVKSEKVIQANPGFNTQTIHRNDLASGIYFLSLSNGAGSITKRFTVVE